MQFFQFLSMCEDLLADFMSGVFGNGTLWSALNDTLGDAINDLLQMFYDAPIIGDVLEQTVGALIDATVGDVSLIYFMVGVGVPSVIMYNFVKWLVGVVTGS